MNSCNEYLSSFPKPLSSEEIAALFELYLGNKDFDAREKIIVHNLRLVAYIVSQKFSYTRCEFEDLLSVGTFGLVKAVDSYNPKKNFQFATYSAKCIQNEILMYLRKENKRILPLSLDAPVSDDIDGDRAIPLEALISDDDGLSVVHEEIDRQENMQRINNYLASRPNTHEKEVIEGLFGINGCEEKNQAEVAEEIGISQSYVSRLSKKIITDLREVVK